MIKNLLWVRVGSFLAKGPIAFWGKTVKFKILGDPMNPSGEKDQNVIYALWHNRLLLGFFYFRSYLLGQKMCVLVSKSYTGEFVSRIFKTPGVYFVRSSPKKNPKEGFTDLTDVISSGHNGWITPDGSRGPVYKAKIGAIHLAQKTRCPIVPLTFGVNRKRVMGSWDRFILPIPFSRGVVIMGEPIYVPEDADKEVLRVKLNILEKSMLEITDRADKYFS